MDVNRLIVDTMMFRLRFNVCIMYVVKYQWQIVIIVRLVIDHLIQEWMFGFIVPARMIQLIKRSMH
jgi:hypothetical protein